MDCRNWIIAGSIALAILGCSRSETPDPASEKPPVEADSGKRSDASATTGVKPDASVAVIPPATAPVQPTVEKHPADVLRHTRQLASEDKTERRAATNFFADRADARTLWLELMTHADATIRRGAAFGLLGQFRGTDEELRTAFLARLEDEDEKVRHIALQAVSDLPDDLTATAVPQLVKMLDPEKEAAAIRARVVRILGAANKRAYAALPALLQSLANDPEKNVRIAALSAIYRVADAAEEIVPATLSVLKSDPDPTLRKQAAGRIAAYGKQAARFIPQLDAALDDKESSVRAAAAAALTKVGPEALPALLARAKGESRLNRVLAIDAIGDMGRKAAAAKPVLEQLAEDKDQAVSQAARVALGKLAK